MKSRLDKALSYSHRLLALRPRSEKELGDRLSKRFDRTTASKVILLLKEKKLLDDVVFARHWVEARTRNNPKGRRLLRRELELKGVNAVAIEEVLSSRRGSETCLARVLARKRLPKFANLPTETAKRRLFGFLLRRGFDYDVAEEAIEGLWQPAAGGFK